CAQHATEDPSYAWRAYRRHLHPCAFLLVVIDQFHARTGCPFGTSAVDPQESYAFELHDVSRSNRDARDRRQPGSGTDVPRNGELPYRRDRDRGAQSRPRDAGGLQPGKIPFSRTRQPARGLSRLTDVAWYRAHRSALPHDQELRPPRPLGGADRDLRVVYASFYHLASKELLSDHTAFTRRSGVDGWMQLAADDVASAVAGSRSRTHRGGNVRLHDSLERLSFCRYPDQYDCRQDFARGGRRLCDGRHDGAHPDGDQWSARDHSSAGAGVLVSAIDCSRSHERCGQGLSVAPDLRAILNERKLAWQANTIHLTRCLAAIFSERRVTPVWDWDSALSGCLVRRRRKLRSP